VLRLPEDDRRSGSDGADETIHENECEDEKSWETTMTTESLVDLASEMPDTERTYERTIAEAATRQRLFGIDEASVRIGLPIWRIYSEIAAARMPCKRVGRRIYFSEADILAYFRRIQLNEPQQADPGARDRGDP
jgi:hypothetical protein